MSTKTCMQRDYDRDGRPVMRRRPHDVPDGIQGGYAECAHCGARSYVGEPRADMDMARFVAGDDAEAVVRGLGYRAGGAS